MKRVLCMLLCVLIVAVMAPTMAFAADDTVEVSTGMTFKSDTTQDAINNWAGSNHSGK